MTQTFSNDAQLREEDAELFHYSDVSWMRKHIRAADDIVRDLKRHGYLERDDEEIIDDSEKATVTLEFSATSDGSLTIPKGTRVRDTDQFDHGAVAFETHEELVVASDDTETVEATAVAPGEVYNVSPGVLEHLETEDELDNLDRVTNPDRAEGGRDHQLARASVYRVLELIMMDVGRDGEDAFEYKRKLYRRAYKDELDRIIASGVDIDSTGDNEVEAGLAHGNVRLRRS